MVFTMKKKIGMALCGCIMLFGLSGCGQPQNSISVVISQGQVETWLSVVPGNSVQNILEEAEITYNTKDKISPSLETTITQENAEIVVEPCNQVTVIEDDQSVELEMNGGKVADALQKAGITLAQNDYIDHDEEAYLSDGMKISVIHRVLVKVNVDGKKQECLTSAKTVQELLEEQGIKLGKKDRVKPARETALADGTKVVIKRVDTKKIKEKQAVAFDVKVEYSNELYTGETQMKQRGVEGEKQVTYKVTYVDGKEEKREMVSEKVTKEPVSQIVLQGTKARRQVVERKRYDDCDGSGHGYEIITWSDGTTEVQQY